MNQYEITTAQNATIRFQIANMGDRIVAAIFDLFILFGYLLLVFFIYIKTKENFGIYDNTQVAFIYFAFTLPVYFYSLLFEYFMNGQTPGKRLRRIKVARLDGKSLTLGNCIIRWLFRLVDIWLDTGAVAIVTATFSRTHQRLGDMVAGTIVISTRAIANINLSQYADPDSSYGIKFPEVEKLKLKDVEAIHEALALYYEKDEFDYVLLASAQLKKALDVIPEMDDLTFVKRVLGDYDVVHKTPFTTS